MFLKITMWAIQDFLKGNLWVAYISFCPTNSRLFLHLRNIPEYWFHYAAESPSQEKKGVSNLLLCCWNHKKWKRIVASHDTSATCRTLCPPTSLCLVFLGAERRWKRIYYRCLWQKMMELYHAIHKMHLRAWCFNTYCCTNSGVN